MDNNGFNLNLLKTFCKVAELGSFTQAASNLKQPKSRVSRAIAKLESELGVELIRRTTRRSTLTDIGKEFYLRVSPLLNGIQDELKNISNYQDQVTGSIRVTCAQDMAQYILSEVIATYSDLYPSVSIETIITNDILDLTRENIDIAIRAGQLKDSTLKRKKIFSTKFIFVASKKYINQHGTPHDILDLNSHKYFSFKKIENQWLKKTESLKPNIISDNLTMLQTMVENHKGISILPDFYCNHLIESGDLVLLFPKLKTKSNPVHLLYHPNPNQSNAVKKFIEIAMQCFNS